MSDKNFSTNKIELLNKLLEESGFGDKEQTSIIGAFAEREQQFRNSLKALSHANKQIKLQSQEQSGLQSTFIRASLNASMFQQAYESDAKVCYVGNMMCLEVPFAMDMIPLNIEVLSSLFATNNTATTFLDISEQNYLSRDICSVIRCVDGAMLKDCLPTPNFIAHASYPCDSSTKMGYRLKEKYNSGYFILDVPYKRDQNSVLYLSNQIKSMITTIEKTLKTKLETRRLEEAVHNSKETWNYLLRTNDLYTNSFISIPLSKSMDYITSYMSLLGSKEMLKIAELSFQEAKKEVILNNNRKKTKPRIIWRGLFPFYNDEMVRYLENQCNFDLIPENNFFYADLQSIMDIDDPYIFLAQKLISFCGPRRIESIVKSRILDTFEQYSVDGVIIFNQWGCRSMFIINQMIRDFLSQRNIPVLEIDGDYIDGRNYSFSQIKVRIDAFAEILHKKNFH